MTWLSLNGDDGVADMDPDATGVLMNNLRGEAANLRDAWTRDNNRLVGPKNIGGGPMGRAFVGLLGEAPAKARTAAGSVPGFYTSCVDLGELFEKVYLAHDAEAASAIWSSVRR
jgi:hypothetical protein